MRQYVREPQTKTSRNIPPRRRSPFALLPPNSQLTSELTCCICPPVSDTVHPEPPEIYPFLGSYRLGQPLDRLTERTWTLPCPAALMLYVSAEGRRRPYMSAVLRNRHPRLHGVRIAPA